MLFIIYSKNMTEGCCYRGLSVIVGTKLRTKRLGSPCVLGKVAPEINDEELMCFLSLHGLRYSGKKILICSPCGLRVAPEGKHERRKCCLSEHRSPSQKGRTESLPMWPGKWPLKEKMQKGTPHFSDSARMDVHASCAFHLEADNVA